MAASFLSHLECSLTQERYDANTRLGLSRAGRPLLCRYDLNAIRSAVARDVFSTRPRGMWRWRELLPLSLDADPVTLGEGDTPLLPAPAIARELGLDCVWIKDESSNPTGSFKARGLSAAVTMARALGCKALSIPSAGNAGGALAAYCARAGLAAHVYVPQDTPEVNQIEVSLYGAQLYPIDGLIDDCGKVAASRLAGIDAFDVSTLKEPYRLEGKKTLGLELAEQLAWTLPDIIIYPTGGGTGLVGMHKAFQELRALGWIANDAGPRFVVVQSDGCAPMVSAFESGQLEAQRWNDAKTCAFGLRVPGAVGDRLILEAVRSSNGTAVRVSDDELCRDMQWMASHEGVSASPEGGACLAALRKLRESGFARPQDRVVLFNTGAGTKYVEVLREVAKLGPAPVRLEKTTS